MIKYNSFAKVKNKVCFHYTGNNLKYLVQLETIKPFLGVKFPDLVFFLKCKRIFHHQLSSNWITTEEIKEFGFTYDVLFDGVNDPICCLCREVDLKAVYNYQIENDEIFQFCLSDNEIIDEQDKKKLQIEFQNRNINIQFVDNLNSKSVASFDNEELYRNIQKNRKCILIRKNNIGGQLFKMIASNDLIVDI